jgi:Glucodextranase, domain B
MRLRVLAAISGTVCSCLLAAGSAAAAVTSSNVTVSAPAGTYLVDDEVTPNEAVALSGTSNGDASDHVDINCYRGLEFRQLASSVPVQADGSFSYTSTTGLRNLAGETCVLRAVPAGDMTQYSPGSPTSFTGPTLAIGEVSNEATQSAGVVPGELRRYYLYASQLRGGFDYDSLGNCSISDSYTYDPVTFASSVLDYCNAWFYSENGQTSPGFLSPTRSELQVDGANAYVAGNALEVPGFPSLTYSYSIDPASGDLALDETDEVVRCSAPAGFPPTPENCPGYEPTGVQVNMHIVQSDDGRVASVAQYFSSTDGQPHAIDALEDNEFSHVNDDGELNFPWTGSGLQPYTTAGQIIPGPAASGPGSFFVKGSASVPDGGESSPQGAVTFADPPDRETIIATTNNEAGYTWADLHYVRTVPATGSVALGFTYSNAFLASEVAEDATAAEAAFRPSVTISSPASGSSTSNRTVAVSGTAGDANGVSSLTVNGRSVAVAPNGAWSTTMALTQGANTITAVATNVFGNVAQAQATITYTPIPPSSGTGGQAGFGGQPPQLAPVLAPVLAPLLTPVISGLSQSHSRWRERGPARKHSPPVGTRFSFTLSEAASVTFTLTDKVAGRRVKGRCVAQTRSNRHKPSCTHTATAGTFSLAGKAGADAVAFSGVLPDGRTLAPGIYTLAIVAVNLAGRGSGAQRIGFMIVKQSGGRRARAVGDEDAVGEQDARRAKRRGITC